MSSTASTARRRVHSRRTHATPHGPVQVTHSTGPQATATGEVILQHFYTCKVRNTGTTYGVFGTAPSAATLAAMAEGTY